jgi:hypothetical protein
LNIFNNESIVSQMLWSRNAEYALKRKKPRI